LGVLSALGELEPLDLIITSDTGWERQVTYDARDFYAAWFRERGITVELIDGGNVRLEGGREHVPFWTETGGPLKRECTREYKIRPIRRRVRQVLGYLPSTPPAPPAGAVEQWLGYTWDEVGRMRTDEVAYSVSRYPLIEMRMVRDDCIKFLASQDLPVPVKSACVGCPYRRASEYLEMQRDAPEEWAEAVEFDEENRHNPYADRGSDSDKLYIYKSQMVPMPLKDANLVADAERERSKQMMLPMCEGSCFT
jgi:hypothetical protein